MLSNFLAMNNKNEQDIHLQRMIEFQPIKRKCPRKGVPEVARKPKNKNITYNLLLRGVRKPVCKKAFFSVHGVTKKRMERLVELLQNNKNPNDMRGKNVSGNKIPAEVIMFQLFQKKFPDDKVSYQFYLNHFKLKFNLRFGRPAKDICGHCEQLRCKIKNHTLTEKIRKQAAAELIVHKYRSKKFYDALSDAKKLAKANPKVAAISLDYMANTSLPSIPVQDVYYLRQLTANTFGIHDLSTEKMVCYPYAEYDGHKGPNEVCSFLYDYIRKHINKGTTKLLLLADNCGGQNKNHTLLRFVMALVDLGLFEEVTITFPIRCHSYMPCDRDFGIIKRKIKRMFLHFGRLQVVDKKFVENSGQIQN